MKRRVILFFLCIVLSASLVGVNEVSAIEYLAGDLIIHGKITETLAMRTKSKRSWELYDYDIFNFRTSLKLESRFEAFRTWKGDMGETLRVGFTLVNSEKAWRVPPKAFKVNEFGHN